MICLNLNYRANSCINQTIMSVLPGSCLFSEYTRSFRLTDKQITYLDCVVPLEAALPTDKLLLEARTSLRELARLARLPDLPPADSRSNTLDVPDGGAAAAPGVDFDSEPVLPRLGRDERRSMIELLN